ncbi:MAG: AMP-binding enzyme, partial [Desulfomonilaceae bacterium]
NENTVSSQDIQEHLSKRFAKWQLPDTVLFVDSIPKTSVGKIDKKVIRTKHQNLYNR